ncbi:MAG: hypothetical protein U0174_10980 [Polyangiaceae bacterium]
MRRALLAVTMGWALVLGACGGGHGAPAKGPEDGLGAGAAVSDDAFAASVRDLIASEPGTAARAQRLEGTVARQFLRASARFRERGNERGIVAFNGALSLVRVGEFHDSLFGTGGPDALRGASREYARRGDEGRAKAIYSALGRVGTAEQKVDARDHLQAIDAWIASQGSGGPVVLAGAAANVAISSFLNELTVKSRDEATSRTAEWIGRAIALRDAFRRGRVPPAREEANEAIRALSSGPLVLVAILLRANDVTSSLDALDRLHVKQLVKPELLKALEHAQSSPSSASWLDLAAAFTPDPRKQPDSEEDAPMEDLEVFRAAAFTCLLEAYRLDPTHERVAFEVAVRLRDMGMAEAVPAILTPAVRAKPSSRFVEAALSLTAAAMQNESEADDRAAARRTFNAAAPILEVAARTSPNLVPRVLLLAGDVELRDGELKRARGYLEGALKAQPSALAEYDLARIETHEGAFDVALRRLARARELPEVQKDAYFKVEIDLLRSDIAREKKDSAGARGALLDAWSELSRAPSSKVPDRRIREELFASRILDRFGAAAQASEALERALDEAIRDKKYVADVVSAMTSRALLRNDLAAGRAALQRGIASDVEPATLVYCALWVRILERRAGASGGRSDPSVDRVLAAAADDARWVGRIAAYGRGQLKVDELVKLAKSPGERTEALFYAALEKSTATSSDESALRAAIEGGGIALTEYAMARDMILERRGGIVLGAPPQTHSAR